MPFKSTQQQRYMFAAAARKEIPKDTVMEWAHATKEAPGGFGALPKRVKKKKKRAPKTAAALFIDKLAARPDFGRAIAEAALRGDMPGGMAQRLLAARRTTRPRRSAIKVAAAPDGLLPLLLRTTG